MRRGFPRRRLLAAPLLLSAVAAGPPAGAADRFITLASTTSTEQSGLFGHVLPMFTARTGITVRVVAVGTGQALRIGERGDADALLVHDRPGEDAFVAAGFGMDRREVMHNDFVVVGPGVDPAGLKGRTDAVEAFRRIAGARAPFVSRGDDSGTYRLERRLWRLAGIDHATGRGGWYRETGSGMGSALNTAAAMGAHILADRGTWLGFKNRGDLAVLLQGDPRLFNPYGVIRVNPARHPHVKEADARAFVDWLTGPEGQRAIASYTIGGEPLFSPDAEAGGS